MVGSFHLMHEELYRAPFVVTAAHVYFLGITKHGSVGDSERAYFAVRRFGVRADWMQE